ncbi:nitroreductase [Acetobacteraceae bacterium B3987]|nr:nitroreductase [Acetobacteraceae bacterium B3987]
MAQASSVSPLNVLLDRSSTGDLVAPAPQGDVLARILSAGLRAPDHGHLCPWRYVVITGDARSVFAEHVVAAVARQEPEAPEKKREKRRKRFSETPMIIALGMHLRPEHKVPVMEQEMAVAAGTMNVLNALHMEGFGGVWVSGAFCEDRSLLSQLGLEAPHRLAGFLLVGTPEKPDRSHARPDIGDYMAFWDGRSPIAFGADDRRKER